MEPGGPPPVPICDRPGPPPRRPTDEALVREHDLRELVDEPACLVEAGHHRIVLDPRGSSGSDPRRGLPWPSRPGGAPPAQGGGAPGLRARPTSRRPSRWPGSASATEVYPDVAPAGRRAPGRSAGAAPAGLRARRPHAVRPRRAARSPPTSPLSSRPPLFTAARLVAQTDPERGRAVVVDGRRFVIGRASDCRLRLGFATVSRHHATIERAAAARGLVDLGSTNGSFLNGRPHAQSTRPRSATETGSSSGR